MALKPHEEEMFKTWPQVEKITHEGKEGFAIFARYYEPSALKAYAEKVNGLAFGLPFILLLGALSFAILTYVSDGGSFTFAFVRYAYLTIPLVLVTLLWLMLSGDVNLRHRLAWREHPTYFNIILVDQNIIINGQNYSLDEYHSFHAPAHANAKWEQRLNQHTKEKIKNYDSHYFQDSKKIMMELPLGDVQIAEIYSPNNEDRQVCLRLNGLVTLMKRLHAESRDPRARRRSS